MHGFTLRAPAGLIAHRLFVALLLLFFLGLSVQYSHKVLANRSAITRWEPQLLSLEAGEDISGRYSYPNPPMMAVLLYPLAKLGQLHPLAAALTWFYLKVALTLLVFRWVFRLVAEAGRPFPAWAQALTVLLSIRPIVGDLQHGNVNLFILFLVVAALTAFSRKRDFLAGLVLALAIACKLTPALFIPYFLWKRAWRCLAGCVVGVILFLCPGVVPGGLLGFEENQQQLTSWYREIVCPYLIDNKVDAKYSNQSLVGVVFRLTTHTPSFAKFNFDEDRWEPVAFANVVNLEPGQARWIVQACQVLFVSLVLWRCRAPLAARGGWRLSVEFGVVLIGMLLFSERTWKHHCVTLVLPFAVLCYYLAVEGRRSKRNWIIAALVVTTLLLSTTSTELLENFGRQAQVYGAYLGAFLILLTALAIILPRQVEHTAPNITPNGTRVAVSYRRGKSSEGERFRSFRGVGREALESTMPVEEEVLS
jgi:alpha-1,2-mannosyltransferase